MSEQDHFLSTTPVDVAIKALQVQIEQLKRIVHTTDEAPQADAVVDNNEDLKQEIKRLQIANDKAEYRIKTLLRTIEEKEQK